MFVNSTECCDSFQRSDHDREICSAPRRADPASLHELAPAVTPTERDALVRRTVFDWLERQTSVHGDVLPWALLLRGAEWEGQRVPLVSMQGIFKPKVLAEVPLSLRTASDGPYEDSFADDHRLLYRYRGTDPFHRDNVGLREAMRRRTPLVYLFGLMEGRYLPVWPVFVVGDDPARLCFTIMADSRDTIADTLSKGAAQAIAEEQSAPRREYITRTVQARLHQQAFRERVLAAYRNQCALCRLRYRELLDASHIIPDGHPLGVPEIHNGLALCKIHHTAFDRHLIGIRPDTVIEVRADVLAEEDGPMLRHGLQGMHGQRIHVPERRAHRPSREALEYRYGLFRAS